MNEGITARRVNDRRLSEGSLIAKTLSDRRLTDRHPFLKSGFTPCQAEQPLGCMELQGKEARKDYNIWKICLERTYS